MEKYYFSVDGINIIKDDFLKVDIKENSIDLIVTSPPYNLNVNHPQLTRNWVEQGVSLEGLR